MADCSEVFAIHATRKLLDRVKEPVREPVAEPSTALGNWYATAMFWRPRQVVLLVSERTLLPVLMPLARVLGRGARTARGAPGLRGV